MSPIQAVVDQVKSGQGGARAAVQAALDKARQAESFQPLLVLTAERALKRADEIDARITAGETVGRLAGVPFVAKDNMLAFGAPTTAASKMLEGFQAPYQAEVINRLEAEGAILIGKANLDAFAHGGSTENSAFGPTKNPHDEQRVPGGSSGGSAAAVALDIVPFALGTDTGGSIRQPASFSGVVGFKPTYGTVSRWGVVAMASSTDVVGPLTKTSSDAALVMDVMAGRDSKDSTTLEDFYDLDDKLSDKPLRIGLVKEWLDQGVDTAVKSVLEETIERLKRDGHQVETVSMPSLVHALAVYYVIVPAEIASNLSRYDGVRYGLRAEADGKLEQLITMSRERGFMAENKRRILIGNYVLSSGYYDAYYKKAQQVRTLIINEFQQLLTDHDFLIGPVAPTPAFKLGEKTDDPLSMYMSDLMTVPASLAGLPAISQPVGEADGLPVGIQLIGQAKQDRRLLGLAEWLESGAKS